MITAEQIETLASTAKMRRQEACVVLILFEAGDTPVSNDDLEDRIPFGSTALKRRMEYRDIGFVRVIVSRVRGRLGRGSIENVFRKGYRLSESGRAVVTEILRSK